MINSQTITLAQLAKVIDHSLLRTELTEADVSAVCVRSCRPRLAALSGSY